jgi:hypothetical protein
MDEMYLFNPAPFTVEKESLALQGASSFAIDGPFARLLESKNLTDELIELRVFVAVQGYKVFGPHVTWNAHVTDVTPAD